VRYFDSRKTYFTTYKGRQIPLAVGPKDEPTGPTYLAALKKFAEVMQVGEASKAEDDNLVITVLDLYAVHLKNQDRLKTLDILLRCTKSAVEDFGPLKVRDLKPLHVQAWLDRMGTNRGMHRGRVCQWGDTMKRMAYDKLMAALNWAVKQKMIPRNPSTAGPSSCGRKAAAGGTTSSSPASTRRSSSRPGRTSRTCSPSSRAPAAVRARRTTPRQTTMIGGWGPSSTGGTLRKATSTRRPARPRRTG